jgi:hypothetical protein
MTTAPQNLKDVRSLLLTHLNIDPDTAWIDDLEPAEVGIVGDSAHRGGYHCGEDQIVNNDYSVYESSRDRNSLTLDAAALDVGLFSVQSRGVTHNLYTFNRWIVGECVANAPDTRDIREVIYSFDGKLVRRFDRLRLRGTGDNSHLWHTHFSFFRDAIKAGRDQTPLFRRYLVHIGLIRSEMLDNADIEKIRSACARGFYDALWVAATGNDYRDLTYSGSGSIGGAIRSNLNILTNGPLLSAVAGTVNQIAQQVNIDPTELAAIKQAASEGVLASAEPLISAIVARLPEDIGDMTREQVVSAVKEGVRVAFSRGLANEEGTE